MLTKLDIKALRTADTILFSHNNNNEESIVCIKRITAKELKHDPYATDKRYVIKTDDNLKNGCKAFYSHYPEYLSLFTAFVRTGDELSLLWERGAGNSDLTRDVGLVSDMLYVEVFRKDKRFVSLIAKSVTKNDSARMIQK